MSTRYIYNKQSQRFKKIFYKDASTYLLAIASMICALLLTIYLTKSVEILIILFSLLTLLFIYVYYLLINFITRVVDNASFLAAIRCIIFEYQARKAVLDTATNNRQLSSDSIEVSDVHAKLKRDMSSQYIIKIEKLAGMSEKKMELLAESLSSTFRSINKNYVVVDFYCNNEQTEYTYIVEDITIDKRLVPKIVSELYYDDYCLLLQDDLVVDISPTVHMLVAANSGAGKTALIRTLLLQCMLMKCIEDIYIFDFKQEFSSWKFMNNYIISDNTSALLTLDELVKLMSEREQLIAELSYKSNRTGANFRTFDLKMIIIVIDEVAAWIASMTDTKQRKYAQELINQLIFKGRSSGFYLILSTQQPNAQVISTAIRDNLLTRILLMKGQTSKELINMIFTDTDSIVQTRDAFSGYVFIDSAGTRPIFFKATDLYKNKLEKISTYEEAYKQMKRDNEAR